MTVATSALHANGVPMASRQWYAALVVGAFGVSVADAVAFG